MTEDQLKRISELESYLYNGIHDLVDEALAMEDEIVEEHVRDFLCDQFRFYKRE